jgi:hypothetical protein
MNLTMHNASVGVFTQMLGNLYKLLDKAEVWVAERKIDPNAILQARLSPDMFPLVRQVQIATDMAKGTAGRLAGQDPPRFEDNETSFAELKTRVNRTIAYLEGLKPEAFAGAETRKVTLRLGPPGQQKEFEFVGVNYLQSFGTPHFYFHYSMVYALLRHNGLDIGKRDYVS